MRSEKLFDLNELGVPDGWSSFATRAQRGTNHLLSRMYKRACQKAGDVPKLFLVYGGGTKIKALCQEHRWLWVPEQMQGIKQRYYG